MKDVDLEEIAEKVVNQCVRVKEDEVIMISGGIHNFELVENIAVEIKKNGAFPEIKAGTERLSKKITEEVDKEILKKTPEHLVRWLDDVDGRIGIDSHKDPRILQQLPEEKIIEKDYALEAGGSVEYEERHGNGDFRVNVNLEADITDEKTVEIHDEWTSISIEILEEDDEDYGKIRIGLEAV